MRPTGVDRACRDDEIIVSKTDLQGRLTYVNDVFVRVSAYPEADLIGQPHSVIRHPDMPRSVFRLLWDTLQDGRELFAYVKNLSGDGAHYWVLAHVTPTFGPGGAPVGYHSSRRTAGRAALDVVEPLYAQLLREERCHANAREAASAGFALLESVLAEQGVSYEEWVWAISSEAVAA